MYELTLTQNERDAISWVGNRYWCGDDLYKLLLNAEWDGEWDDDTDITFKLPEHVAWQIRDGIMENGIDCFSPEFEGKLYDFCNIVV